MTAIALLPVDPEVAWTIAIEAAMCFAIGVTCIVAPGILINLQIRMLEWQRRVFGEFTVNWHLRLVRSRATPWIVRLAGLFFVLAGIYLFASAVAAWSGRPAP